MSRTLGITHLIEGLADMTKVTTPNATESAVRRVWKSAQMYIAFHKDQSNRQRKEPKLWPPKNGSASLHGDTAEQEAIVVVKLQRRG